MPDFKAGSGTECRGSSRHLASSNADAAALEFGRKDELHRTKTTQLTLQATCKTVLGEMIF